MKLLLDENLSFRLIDHLAAVFPDSQHVDTVGLHSHSDATIWEFARDNNFVLVSKDDDFRQLALLYGAPPKVIWLPVGNAGTETILSLLMDRRAMIESFIADQEESLLILGETK